VLARCAAYRQNLRTGRYEYVSPMIEETVGFSADEVYGMTAELWLARVHPGDRPRVHAELMRIAAGGSSKLEYRFRHKDGRYCWVADRADVLPEPEEFQVHRVGILRLLPDQPGGRLETRAGVPSGPEVHVRPQAGGWSCHP
jgi:PAS domain S-box-containing protein